MFAALPFWGATLVPAALLSAACLLGGLWSLAAIAAITVVIFGLDHLPVAVQPGPDDGRRLSHLLGWLHFPLLGLSVWAVAQGGPLWSSALLVIAAGLFFGQISNSNAHELIHRRDRGAFRLGAAVYTSLLFGHHTSAHRLVHHVHAATPLDPASAPGGRGFWAYLPRAWVGGFRAGLRAERQRAGGQMWPAPYRAYILGAFCSLMAAYTLGGVRGLAALLLIASYAQVQLMLSDYVQHYGLTRAARPGGGYGPISDAHAWNAPHWCSSAMMLNAPRHSAHHSQPGKAFPQLGLDAQSMPMLPYALPVMAVLALVPPLWRRVMDPRVGQWRHRAAGTSTSLPAAQ